MAFTAKGSSVSCGLCLSGLGLGLVSVVFSHPRLGLGVWHDAEGVNVAVTIAAALCFLGVGGFWAFSRKISFHPAMAVLLALGMWSAFCALFAEYPVTALLGPPQTMYGAVWFFAQAAFLAAALIVVRQRRLFRVLLYGAALMAAVVAWFNMRSLSWLPLDWLSPLLPQGLMHGFNEYLGHQALGLLALAAVLPHGRFRWAGIALGMAGLTLLVLSGNRAAAGAALLGAGVLFWQQRGHVIGHYRLRVGCALGLTTVPAIMVYLLVRFGSENWLVPSLLSRQILLRVLEPALWTPSWSLFVGHGWGHFQSTLLSQLPLTGISLTQPEWIDYARDEFHSHHALAEALFATGIPGAVLLALIPVAIIVGARPALRAVALGLAVALVVLDSFWFQLPETMPVLALAVAATSRRRAASLGWAWWPHRGVAGVAAATAAICLAMVLGGAAVWQARSSMAMDDLRRCLDRGRPRCGAELPADPRQSQMVVAVLIDETLERLLRLDWPVQRTERFRQILDEASKRCNQSCSPSLAVSLMHSHLVLAYSPKAGQFFSAEQWRLAARHLVLQAPLRTDVLAPYLNWLLTNGGNEAVARQLASLPVHVLQSPVGIWFSGLLLLDEPDQAERGHGIVLMRQALAQGLERYMIVDPSIKSALETAP